MAKRPAQGRGSGGRVTPRARPAGGGSADRDDRPRGKRLEREERGGRVGFRQLIDPQRTAGGRVERERPWWGFGDVLLWFVVGQTLALLVPIYVAQLAGYAFDRPIGPGSRSGEVIGRVASGQGPEVTRTWVDLPLWLSQGVLMLPLWAAFIGGPLVATARKGFGPVKDLRLRVRPLDIPLGLAIGLAAQLVLNPLLYWVLFRFTGEQDVSAGARSITDKATSPALVVLLFVTVGFVAPIAEELFFRGLALQSLVRRFGPLTGLVLTSVFFALVHSNPLYFVALIPLALILGALVLHFDRLGPAIAAHVGYNLVTATVLVFDVELPW
jgi:uncharacterized protein